MIAVFVFIAAVVLLQPLKEMIIIARDANHLDCENQSISTGQKMTCIIVDLYLPYFIGAVLAGSVYLIFAKVVG
ncbi:MAG TPA: hypothetical protein ENF67_01015 [Candidatus Pacearchaeota archaeon]|nr:hypothetical protein [Candidatus Pacearchaeota archaeon]